MVQHLTKELKNAHEEMSRRNCDKPKSKPTHKVKHQDDSDNIKMS